MATITVGQFAKHAHDVLYQRYCSTIVEPAIKTGGIIAQAGLIIDEDVGYVLGMCIYDHFTGSYYIKKLNVNWADDRNRSWLAGVLLDHFVDIVHDVRVKTQSVIREKHDAYISSFGGKV